MVLGINITRKAFITSLVGTCLGIGFIVKDRWSGKKYPYKVNYAVNKVIIITGASSGIGKALAKELALRKGKIVLACRDMDKCEQVRTHLMFYCKNKNITCMECNLAHQKSIKKFANEFNSKFNRLDVLVNNAGVFGGKARKITRDGIEQHLGVNHMGHFLLTNLLIPKLKESAPSRIVNVVDKVYKKGAIQKEDLNLEKEYDAYKGYKQSALANVLFTKELAKRLEGTGVTVNAVYPGVVQTHLLRETSFYNSWLSTVIIKPFLWMFVKNPHRGCQTLTFATIDPSIKDVTGRLFENFEQYDLDVSNVEDECFISKWLWNVSEKWTKLNEVQKS